MELKQAVFYADFDFNALHNAVKKNRVQFEPLSRFPSVQRDLALVLDRNVSFSDVRQWAMKKGKPLLTNVELFDVFDDESRIGTGKKSYAVRFTFENKDRTLQDKDIDNAMHELQKVLQDKLQAQVRQ